MFIKKIKESLLNWQKLLTPGKLLTILFGTAILSFGIYNIHRQAGITEGGVLGLILLFNHWFGIKPAIVSPALDILCYIVAFRFLGGDFLKVSAVSTVSLAGWFYLWEQFPPMLPAALIKYQLIAALAGGLFVGVGVGLVVRSGGSTGGDDALALVISKVTGLNLFQAYLFTDITVLLLSLTYIPLQRIAFSVITVTVSSLIIDLIKGDLLRKKTK